MFQITRKTIEWGGQPLTLETGRMARQADGAVLATLGETSVLCAVVAARQPRPDLDFFPLTVHYQEKAFAAGKIPGGFFKREGRPSEKEVLTSRLIDRPIRPLFHPKFKNETQVICTVLSHDLQNDPDMVAMAATSAALTISGIPFLGPIAGARVGYIDGNYVLNPNEEELKAGDLDLIVAGTRDSVLMVESEAKELSEEIMLGAVKFGHEQMQPVINAIIELAQETAKEPWDLPEDEDHSALEAKIRDLAETKLRDAYAVTDKQARRDAIDTTKASVKDAFAEEEDITPQLISGKFKALEQEIVRGDLLKNKKRIDGRGPADIRQIEVEVGVIPRTHGSALFTRGETQALVVSTLGTGQDEQIIDALAGEYRESFMLHYNFPPYSVGEVSPMRPPGRREIGHGKLAWRAVRAALPEKEDFPYTLRIVSEVTESNGSSSMATVCGSSLAMMDAGVPLRNSIAGIAMGLVKEDDDFVVLSDIMGDEDHLGDMDFKVAGTKDGITALQMDIKITGITSEIMQVALAQAKDGRSHILGCMDKVISQGREGINPHAPRLYNMKIDPDKIREVIGSGGKVIREICAVSNATVDIEDDGSIVIAAVKGEDAERAIQMIEEIVAEPEMGAIYDGTVVRIVDFGAFVRFLGPREGLVHISEFSDERIDSVTEFVQEGDNCKVKVIGMDRGKVRLSYKAVDQESGEDMQPDATFEAANDAQPRRGGGGNRKREKSSGGAGGNNRPRKRTNS